MALISFILKCYLLFRFDFLYLELIFPPIRVNLSRVRVRALISYNKVVRLNGILGTFSNDDDDGYDNVD